MAGGFGKGLLHGAVVSVIGLGALSLLAPLSDVDREIEPDATAETQNTESMPDADARAPDSEETPSSNSDEAAPSTDAGIGQTDPAKARSDDTGPQSTSIELPAGSEFGRGSDTAPQAPADLSRLNREDHPSTLAATTPADDSVPVRELPSDMQPESVVPTQPDMPEAEEMPGFDLPATQPAPNAGDRPGLADQQGPESPPAAVALTASDPQNEDTELQTETTERQSTAPALPAPSLNLSTPPDLSELRALERTTE